MDDFFKIFRSKNIVLVSCVLSYVSYWSIMVTIAGMLDRKFNTIDGYAMATGFIFGPIMSIILAVSLYCALGYIQKKNNWKIYNFLIALHILLWMLTVLLFAIPSGWYCK